jgi:hypothetical protein
MMDWTAAIASVFNQKNLVAKPKFACIQIFPSIIIIMTSSVSRTSSLLRRAMVSFPKDVDLQANPLIFTKAKGNYCWTNDGRKFIDAIGGR